MRVWPILAVGFGFVGSALGYIEEGRVNWDQMEDTNNAQPAIAACGSEVWVVWLRSGYEGSGWYYTRWEGDGWAHEQELNPGSSSGSGKYWLRLAMDDSAAPHAAWAEYDNGRLQLFYSRWTGSGWSAAEQVTFDPRDHYAPDLAVSTDGVPCLVWTQHNPQTGLFDIWGAFRGPGGWHAPEAVEPDGNIVDWDPSVAWGPDGTIHVVWHRYGSAGDQDICFAVRDTAWSAPGYVTRTVDEYEQLPRIAAGADGVWAVWQTSVFGEATRRIMAARWTALGWQLMGQVSDLPTMLCLAPRLCIAPSGDPWVTWWTSSSDVYLCGFEDGAWGPNRQVTIPDSLVDHVPALASDAQGVIWVVWEGGHFYDGYDNDMFYGRLDPSGATNPEPVARRLDLGAPFPNPARGTVQVPVHAWPGASVSLAVHDMAGRLVWRLSPRAAQREHDTFVWEGIDTGGRSVPPGTYVISARASGQRAAVRIVRE